jgi:hypothetical protein
MPPHATSGALQEAGGTQEPSSHVNPREQLNPQVISSLTNKLGGKAAQFSLTKGPGRRLFSCMMRATSSFPVPVSSARAQRTVALTMTRSGRSRWPESAVSCCYAALVRVSSAIGQWGALGVGLAAIACHPPPAAPGSHPTAPGIAPASTTASPSNPKPLQASSLRLNDAEWRLLDRQGFVITEREQFPTFAEGWLAIFKADQPLFISADALLEPLHRSYDALLRTVEESVLASRLDAVLLGVREHLNGAGGHALPQSTRSDVDLVVAVALNLLEPETFPSVTRAAADLANSAIQGSEPTEVVLLGVRRNVDWSLFVPRGHYRNNRPTMRLANGRSTTLANYFRALTWLGLETPFATPKEDAYALARRPLAFACAWRALMHESELAAWRQLEATMDGFIGPPDAMSPTDVDRLYTALGVRTFADFARVSDATLLAAVLAGHLGEQKVQGSIEIADPRRRRRLARTFAVAGARYIADSEVFSNVIEDRVPHRLMPDPLDVAYTLLGNPDAEPLLANETNKYSALGPALEDLKASFAAEGPPFWEADFSATWFAALRALSPSDALRLPPAIHGDAWGLRILGTQLSGWAELRHDTVLYAKPSFTPTIICSYPDAYVDPYPAFYERLAMLLSGSRARLEGLDFSNAEEVRTRIIAFFTNFQTTVERIGRIARDQAMGTPLAPADLAFVNHAVTEEPASGVHCGPVPPVLGGWYARLFFDGDATAFAPTITDVHTQPTDAAGSTVGYVLHAGTAKPRIIVINLGDAQHVRPVVGLVATYAQFVTKGFVRRTDAGWAHDVAYGSVSDVSWMQPIVGR